MSESGAAYEISGIDLTDDSYTVEQSLIRNKYRAMDEAGNVVLRGKQNLLKMKEKFPFSDGDGNEVFTVEAGSVLDIAGNYALIDAGTGETVVVLDNDYSLFQDTWTIRDGDTEAKLAELNSRGAAATILRNLPYVGALFSLAVPTQYEIIDADGDHVGTIDGQISLKDRYDITIDDASSVPKEAVVAAAMVTDAIQGN
jgi:hypothetical protein